MSSVRFVYSDGHSVYPFARSVVRQRSAHFYAVCGIVGDYGYRASSLIRKLTVLNSVRIIRSVNRNRTQIVAAFEIYGKLDGIGNRIRASVGGHIACRSCFISVKIVDNRHGVVNVVGDDRHGCVFANVFYCVRSARPVISFPVYDYGDYFVILFCLCRKFNGCAYSAFGKIERSRNALIFFKNYGVSALRYYCFYRYISAAGIHYLAVFVRRIFFSVNRDKM